MASRNSIEYSIEYITSLSEADAACSEIKLKYKGRPLGFDMEWHCNTTDQVDVVQICPDPSVVYLFHLTAIKDLPRSLVNLLGEPVTVKAGVGIWKDFEKLETVYGVTVNKGIVNLPDLAERKGYHKEQGKWGLKDLAKKILGWEMEKDDNITLSNWSDVPLSSSQQEYAADDAYASLMIYKKLIQKR